jgi:ABC-type multidrug transport system fused ATPase/permease subunit
MNSLGNRVDGWFTYLKKGLSRKRTKDRIESDGVDSGIMINLKNLYPFLIRHRRKWMTACAIFLAAALLALPSPLITRYLIDHVILAHRMALLPWVILALVLISAGNKVLGVVKNFYFTRLEQTIFVDIQSDLFQRVLRFPKSFFDDKETGYLMSRLSQDVEGLRWFFSATVARIAENCLRFVGGIALLFYVEWRLAVVVLAILPAVFFIVRYFSARLRVLGHREMEQQANVSGFFQEALTTVPLIKAFSSEDRTFGKLVSKLKTTFNISLEQTSVSSLAGLLINSMPDLARVVVLAAGAYWVIKGEWTLGSLYAFQAYLVYVYGPAQFLAVSNLQLQQALASLERVSALFDIVPEENADQGKRVQRLKGEVEFENVSFSYDGREKVLQNISFHIFPGEHVGIVGPSGVGKTTLISLILCFYRPFKGEIRFDNSPASEYEVRSLRRRIGYVSQNTLLLSGTIRDNLCYGNEDATQEQVARAARVAGIQTFIESLPDAYETLIGERGVNLSEGQKQRLSIARALVKEPDMLVMDEPTSSLDSLTEMSVLGMLPEAVKDHTMFVVAHRLSTIEKLDRILLLNENRLVAFSDHHTLLRENAYYRTMVMHQRGDAQDDAIGSTRP